MPQKINVERLEIYATDLECRLIFKSQSEKKIPEMETDPTIERQMHYFKMQYDVHKIESQYIGLKNIFFNFCYYSCKMPTKGINICVIDHSDKQTILNSCNLMFHTFSRKGANYYRP